jgi:exodeoxyribonuclease III
MKLATFNVNGINGRLPVLLRWLEEKQPDIACLQELKTSDEKFPQDAIGKAGYGAIWQGQKSYNGVAILARGREPIERRRGLPGDPDDTHSRYLEAEIDGLVVGCLHSPNRNPAPGPKFERRGSGLFCQHFTLRSVSYVIPEGRFATGGSEASKPAALTCCVFWSGFRSREFLNKPHHLAGAR